MNQAKLSEIQCLRDAGLEVVGNTTLDGLYHYRFNDSLAKHQLCLHQMWVALRIDGVSYDIDGDDRAK